MTPFRLINTPNFFTIPPTTQQLNNSTTQQLNNNDIAKNLEKPLKNYYLHIIFFHSQISDIREYMISLTMGRSPRNNIIHDFGKKRAAGAPPTSRFPDFPISQFKDFSNIQNTQNFGIICWSGKNKIEI